MEKQQGTVFVDMFQEANYGKVDNATRENLVGDLGALLQRALILVQGRGVLLAAIQDGVRTRSSQQYSTDHQCSKKSSFFDRRGEGQVCKANEVQWRLQTWQAPFGQVLNYN